ncbi:hypothetical protein J3S85_11855 [Streptomyces lavenduligriseus]|nr:hypothetical protein J3S85_11855 [Streptomyces lavenduligriseus]
MTAHYLPNNWPCFKETVKGVPRYVTFSDYPVQLLQAVYGARADGLRKRLEAASKPELLKKVEAQERLYAELTRERRW